MRRSALATAATLAGALLLGPRAAEAHLMANGSGTVNVVGNNVYTVLAVPVSALRGVDDDHDGFLDAHELERHEAELREQLDRRLAILDGATVAKTVRVDLVLSLSHEGPGDRADHVVVLKHATLDAPPVDLRLRADLFGDALADKAFKVTGTRHPDAGLETDIATLTPDAPEHAFFRPAPAAQVTSPSGPPAPPWSLLGVAALGAAALLATRRQPARARVSASRALARASDHVLPGGRAVASIDRFSCVTSTSQVKACAGARCALANSSARFSASSVLPEPGPPRTRTVADGFPGKRSTNGNPPPRRRSRPRSPVGTTRIKPPALRGASFRCGRPDSAWLRALGGRAVGGLATRTRASAV